MDNSDNVGQGQGEVDQSVLPGGMTKEELERKIAEGLKTGFRKVYDDQAVGQLCNVIRHQADRQKNEYIWKVVKVVSIGGAIGGFGGYLFGGFF